MRQILLTFCFLLLYVMVEAHSGKARFHVIIDTDGAADDLRAICMLLGNREVEVLAITTNEGALTPVGAASKVTELLHHFHHEGIPVGTGRALNIAAPAWRQQSEQIRWGNETNISAPLPSAAEIIKQALESEDEKIIFLCFGALTNVSDALTAQPSLKEQTDRVIWYNSSANPLKGANYDADRTSAERVLASGIKIEMVSGEGHQEILVDEKYVDMISRMENPSRFNIPILPAKDSPTFFII